MKAIELASIDVVGFRFHPTDEELVDHYMNRKMQGHEEEVSEIIPEIDMCKFEPWELPGLLTINSEKDTSWYFFCRPDYKYAKSKRLNRTTKEGFWKVTGKDRMIKGGGGRKKKDIGSKKTLVFHENNNKPKSIKTNWVIHEYHSKVPYPNQREIVLCRLKYKHDDITDISSSEEGETSQQHLLYDLENGADDAMMGEADGSRLDEIMAEFQSLIDVNQNSFTISDDLLRSMFNTPEPERPQLFVNSFPQDQNAYSHEGMHPIFHDYSPSKSSSRVRIRERSPRFADYEDDNYMFERQEGLPCDTLTNKSQNRSQTVMAREPYIVLQADVGDSSSKVTSRIMHHHKQGGGSSTSHNEPKCRNHEEVESPVVLTSQGRREMYSPPKAASKNKAKEAEGQGDTDDLKGNMVVESNKSSKMAESSSSSRSSKSKSPSPQAPGRQGKNWFIVMESSPLNLIEEPPPSVYMVKAVLGVFLFVVFLRELMVLH